MVGRQSKGGGSYHDRHHGKYSVCTALGAERDRGGILKPTQVIKTFLEKENQHETWRQTHSPVREPGCTVGFCRWLGRECALLSDCVVHTYRVSLVTTRALSDAQGSFTVLVYGETETWK